MGQGIRAINKKNNCKQYICKIAEKTFGKFKHNKNGFHRIISHQESKAVEKQLLFLSIHIPQIRGATDNSNDFILNLKFCWKYKNKRVNCAY